MKSVRSRKPELIEQGLRALTAEGGLPDMRDSLIVLARVYNSAAKLGLDDAVFERIAPYCETEEFGHEMAFFPKRPTDVKNLQAFGLVEQDGPEGFYYEFQGFAGRR